MNLLRHSTRQNNRDAYNRLYRLSTYEKSTRLILEGLGFVAPRENARPLPWNPSLSKKHENKNVRPIFWKNRISPMSPEPKSGTSSPTVAREILGHLPLESSMIT
ncbi:hypothetical protein BGX30_000962, partial [Mortierella sp. GBA39]